MVRWICVQQIYFKAWPTYEKSVEYFQCSCYRNCRNTSCLSQIFKWPQISSLHTQALPGLLSIQKYKNSFCLLPQQWQQHDIVQKALSLSKIKSMIKYLETTEKYTYRGDHEILELHCIFTLKCFPFILIELKNLFKWHSNHANSPDVIICCWPKVLQVIF